MIHPALAAAAILGVIVGTIAAAYVLLEAVYFLDRLSDRARKTK